MEEVKVDHVSGSRGAQWTTAGTLIGLLANNLLGGGLLGTRGIGAAAMQGADIAYSEALAQKDAEIAALRAEKYSDNNDAATYRQTLADNNALSERIHAVLNPVVAQVAELKTRVTCDKETAELREKLVRSELGAKIDSVAQTCGCGIAQLNQAVAGINATLSNITKQVIPTAAICPEVMERYNSWTAPTAAATT